MKYFALIGYPLTFSRSPEIYRPWFKQHNIDASYETLPLRENQLESFFANDMRNHFDGINITTPYKTKSIEFIDELSDLARETGSINCVKRENGRLIGDNTDIYGFEEMVSSIKFAGKKIVIIGAGGAATSALYALKNYNPDIMNRSQKQILGQNTIPMDLEKLEEYDIIINATTIAIFTLRNFNPKHQILIDLNYKFSNEYNGIANIITGETMLLKQAEKAFGIWFQDLFSRHENVVSLPSKIIHICS
jgi:shikimate dehydrogenase